jgi:hypothetical protein
MNRRLFFSLAAGAILTPEGLWIPGEKSIFLPPRKILVRCIPQQLCFSTTNEDVYIPYKGELKKVIGGETHEDASDPNYFWFEGVYVYA